MPNRNCNNVTIHASMDDVLAWLVPLDHGGYTFDLRKLFPDRVRGGDDDRELIDGCSKLTGSKWNPRIDYCEGFGTTTALGYDSARSPNNGTLERLHELTDWTIENEYEEPGVGFEGTFTCDGGSCSDDEREYRPLCDVCDEKKAASEFDNDYEDGTVCNVCLANKPVS